MAASTEMCDKVLNFIFKDFAADIRKFHQEHKDKNLEENNFLRQVSGNSLTVSKPKLCARSFSRNSSVGSEFRTVSMMALEDLELVDDVVETVEKYTEEEKIKIQEGIKHCRAIISSLIKL